ncbi:type II secretion system F family protein [Geodermatophilus sp. FMUSA9-8]|uniref:type II secretion system F family protein n=1 Tax=Geodermatophilus sp. FMUSA9-8 TaxID=3120155 RepID=UPI00300AD940
MSAALLLTAGALLLWPGAVTRRRSRLRRLVRPRGTPATRPAALPRAAWPLPAALLAGAAGSLAATPLVGALAAAGAAGAVRGLARARDRRAAEERLDGLTDALAALSAELRGGRPPEDAAGAAVAGCTDAGVADGLARALRAPAAVGPGATDLDRALARVAAAVLLSARTGCSLAAVVAAVEDDLRARRRQRQELRSVTAGPRASAALLAGLPLLALAMGSGIGADPWSVLTTTGAGQVLLVLGVALETAGLAWSARLVRRAVAGPAAAA